tara:strand:+ start:2445 stop:4772 length:2328 start_codon:yes stop_codon:yes gene_type:complete
MSNEVKYEIMLDILDAVKELKKLQQQTKKSKDKFDEGKKSGVQFAAQIGSAFLGMKAAADTVVNAIQKVAGAFIDAAVASFELSRAVVDNINDLNDLSARSSISAQNIEALKVAFVASGQSADGAKTIISQFPRVLTQVQKEGSRASRIMEKLGISVKDKTTGAFRSGNEVFADSIRKIQGIQDQTLKAQTATAIFGRSAGDLLQALAAGEFDEFTDSIERYGTKAGPEASKQAAEFQKRLALIEVVADRAKQALVENTGALDFFIQGLRFTQQSLAGLNKFLQVGQKGIRALAKDIVNFTVRSFIGLSGVVLDLIGGPLLNLIRTIDTLQQQITGVSLFEKAIEEIKEYTVQQYNLSDALEAGLQAFEAEGNIIDASTKATVSNTEQNKFAEQQLKELTQALLEKETANKKDEASTKKNTHAQRLANAAIKFQNKLIQANEQEYNNTFKAINDVRKITREAQADQVTALEEINRLEQERLLQLILIGKQEGINTEQAQEAVRARAQRERAGISAAQIGTVGGKIAGGIGALADPGSLVNLIGAAFGPVGMAVGEVVNALGALGEKSPEEIQQEYENFFRAVVNGLQILPELIFKTLPPILFEAAFLIIRELIALPARFASALIEGIGQVVNSIREFFSGKGFLKGISDALGLAISFLFKPVLDVIKGIAQFFGGDTQSFMSGGRYLSAQGGLRFTGQNQGLAMLHQGEMVVPRSGQMSSTVQRDVEQQTSRSGGVTININSAVTERSAIDSLVRKIEDRFGSFGQSTSPLFGGQ